MSVADTAVPVNAASLIRRFSSLEGRLDHTFLADRLAGARSYKRISGYFRSSILELVGEELESIRHVRIVCNSELDPIDINVSKAAREVALKERWNQLPLTTESLQFAGRYLQLYKLLTSGRLQIKVVPAQAVFVHGKAGVIELADGRKTSFIGSANDSRRGFAVNYEMVWEDPSEEGVKWVEHEFDALWKIGHDLPDAIITEIRRVAERAEVTFASLKPEEVPAAAMVEAPIYRSGEQLQAWQRSFVATFLEHREVYGKARLLIADEVGLGKTLSMATAALVSSLLDDGPVLILCPATLLYQWQTELKDRLGVQSAVWNSSGKEWVDPQGRTVRTRGAEDVVRCPYQIAIVSTGLITAGSLEAQFLRNQRVGTLILDEAHKARMRASLTSPEEPNNLLAFMRVAAGNARHVLLGTATPIQTTVRELWDLMSVLSIKADFVLGQEYQSRWRRPRESEVLVNGQSFVTDESIAWDLIRAPLVPPNAPMLDPEARRLMQSVRGDLDLPDQVFFTSKSYTDLSLFTRNGDFADVLQSNFFRRNNPFVRHVVLRRRKTLEDAGLLEKVAVDVHPDPRAPTGTYRGVTFTGLGLMTNHSFEHAYQCAEGFIDILSKRTRSAGLLRSIFLQRICSSFASGLATVERMLERRVEPDEESPIQELEIGVLRTLEDTEIEYLEAIRAELRTHRDADPKLNAVKWFLRDFRTPSSKGLSWAEMGCIVFTQYFDTAYWVARELAAVYPDEIVAVYAGAGKSGLYRGDRFVSEERDTIKTMVRERIVKLVVATDAACEGLNLQTLGTLINIDLPWNPSRLEQRLGRIKRFGQVRDSVDMLNLVYHETRDEDVYATLSARMKSRFDIFGGLPDCIDADWIENLEEFNKLAETHLHMREQLTNIFEEKWALTVQSDSHRWDECTRVLSRSDIDKKMSAPW